jgi:hypothetical protein
MNAKCTGELRVIKGALVFIPDGTEHYLRVRTQLTLPEGFHAGRARFQLLQHASEIRAAAHGESGIHPAEGIPERISGVVTGVAGDRAEIQAGPVPVVITLPRGQLAVDHRITARVDEPLWAECGELL